MGTDTNYYAELETAVADALWDGAGLRDNAIQTQAVMDAIVPVIANHDKATA